MPQWTHALEASALALAVLWLLLGLRQRPRAPLEIAWLVFCGSLALLMGKRLGGAELGAWQFVIGLGACCTCNAFWLVARGLFQPGRPFGAPQLGFALGIAGLLMLDQLLQLAGATGWLGSHLLQRSGAVLDELLGLGGSTVLVLAFWEGLRGWTTAPPVERRVRMLYLGTYGSCVLLASILPRLAGPAQAAAVDALSAAAAALLILLVTQALVWWRLRYPLAAVEPDLPLEPARSPAPEAQVDAVPAPAAEVAASPAEHALARRLDALVRERQLHLQPELKLVHLAQALDVSEYRISRAITGALGERNVNRYLNRLRIAHARRLLRDPAHAGWSILAIALESGFASLGPFNRAFKDGTGQTPGEYRAGGVAGLDATLDQGVLMDS